MVQYDDGDSEQFNNTELLNYVILGSARKVQVTAALNLSENSHEINLNVPRKRVKTQKVLKMAPKFVDLSPQISQHVLCCIQTKPYEATKVHKTGPGKEHVCLHKQGSAGQP